MQAAIYSSASHVSKVFQAFLASSACQPIATLRFVFRSFSFLSKFSPNPSINRTLARRLSQALVPLKTNLFSPCLFKRHSVSQVLFSAGFVVFLGFACWRCVLQALRCLGGAALFHSSRPSPNSCYPFWLLALTFRSSRPAYGGRLTSSS